MEILAQRTPTTFLVRTKGKLGRIFRFKDSRFQEIKMGSERLMASLFARGYWGDYIGSAKDTKKILNIAKKLITEKVKKK